MGSLSRVVKIDSSPPGDGPRRARSIRHSRGRHPIGFGGSMVAFIAGPDTGYITGASHTIDGGTNA
jgi:hypothetical protein